MEKIIDFVCNKDFLVVIMGARCQQSNPRREHSQCRAPVPCNSIAEIVARRRDSVSRGGGIGWGLSRGLQGYVVRGRLA